MSSLSRVSHAQPQTGSYSPLRNSRLTLNYQTDTKLLTQNSDPSLQRPYRSMPFPEYPRLPRCIMYWKRSIHGLKPGTSNISDVLMETTQTGNIAITYTGQHKQPNLPHRRDKPNITTYRLYSRRSEQARSPRAIKWSSRQTSQSTPAASYLRLRRTRIKYGDTYQCMSAGLTDE